MIQTQVNNDNVTLPKTRYSNQSPKSILVGEIHNKTTSIILLPELETQLYFHNTLLDNNFCLQHCFEPSELGLQLQTGGGQQ